MLSRLAEDTKKQTPDIIFNLFNFIKNYLVVQLTLTALCLKNVLSFGNPRLCGATPFQGRGQREALPEPPSLTKGVPLASGGGCSQR